jgi:hypothetical protein
MDPHKNYIVEHIMELKINERKDLLQMIIGGMEDMNKIVEKGNGTQIKFADMSPELIKSIYNYVHNKVENKADLF